MQALMLSMGEHAAQPPTQSERTKRSRMLRKERRERKNGRA
jgi:hypothetical protein